MNVADAAVQIHHAIHRHAAQLEKIDLLFVRPRNGMLGIGQTNERNFFLCPILLEGLQSIWTDRHDLGTARRELGVVITHARQLRAAMRSHKAAQKSKQNGFASAKAGKTDGISIYIVEFKIRGKFTGGYQEWFHRFSK